MPRSPSSVDDRGAATDELEGGGAALKRAIHVGRARSGITSDTALAIRAGVHYDTLMNWYSGRTTPRPAELAKVARVLDVSLNDLLSAYEGRPLDPPPVQDAIRELVEELRLSRAQQHESTMAILQAIAAVVPIARAREETRSGTPS